MQQMHEISLVLFTLGGQNLVVFSSFIVIPAAHQCQAYFIDLSLFF